jgi:hypothetical protein
LAGEVFAILLATLLAQPATLDAAAAKLFLRDLQREVARDDRPAVAARIRYPTTVFAGGVRIPIVDAATLIQSYEVVFSPALKDVIAQGAIVVSAQVAQIGGEALRLEPVGAALKITRITVPVGNASPTSRTVAPRSPGTSGTSGSTQRLGLAVGRMQRTGTLATIGARNSYVFTATKNQLIEIRINGVSGRDVVAHVIRSRTSTPVDSRARRGVRTWIGRLPAEGEYRIEVVRLAPGATAMPYVMVVSLQ